MAQFTADAEGKIRMGIAMGGEQVATFSITGRDGVPFVPGQVVEYTDAELQSIAEQLMAPFRTLQAPVVRSA